jgi:tetratricopeptide (TPR) repeat protein
MGSAPKPSTSPAPQLQRQTSAQETLAHAQGLWAAGSREAALDLMREAVAVAERAYQSGTLAAGSPVLASLVRELARMELAEGRVSRVLELLTRLEPALAGQADLWAVRGNAAQRLARHQESVHAYLQALELRPDEPRWMLGAAVSLAALGRLDEAAVQAEKARASATVSPEILTYLRQAGVPLK